MSNVSVAAGGIVSLGIIVGAIRFDPALTVGAIAAVIGGAVVFGSNTSTLNQAMADMKTAEAYRTDLINRMDLTVVRAPVTGVFASITDQASDKKPSAGGSGPRG